MGSKHRLLPWLHDVLAKLPFETALDAFSGSGAVSYLLKAMDKSVTSNDALRFTSTIARATVETTDEQLSRDDVVALVQHGRPHPRFIERTFSGIFYTPSDLRFLDRVWGNLDLIDTPLRRALALAALCRACVKRQPRGVFTVAGDPARYDDGRRDLTLTLAQHFVEQVAEYNACVFRGAHEARALCGDVFALDPCHQVHLRSARPTAARGRPSPAPAGGGGGEPTSAAAGVASECVPYDLVYLDPPYVPRADDNCYIKRYHFLEGLACYWRGVEIQYDTRVRKIAKPYTPFGYRRTALAAFDTLFQRFSRSIVVLSYSSNGYPDLDTLVTMLRRYKRDVCVHERPHRYHFGTHRAVARSRSAVTEYLIVGT